MLSDIVLKRPMRQLSTGCRIVYVRNYMETSGPSQGDHVRQRVAQIVGSLLRSSYNTRSIPFYCGTESVTLQCERKSLLFKTGKQETQSLKSNTYTLHNVYKVKLYYHDLFYRRWSLFSHHHWIEPMKYSSLSNMLLKIHEKWKTGELSQREVKPLCKFS